MLELLRGIRVIDLTTIVSGPYATQILGDLGADVIKVESPAGDLFRAVRPGRSAHMGAGYLNCNRNKRSIVIDLKDPRGQPLLRRLLQRADVLVHNMRAQAAAELGLAYRQLHHDFPRLVYCHAPGFGHAGRYDAAPAYDDIIQALCGLAHLNRNEEQPRFLRTIVCDKVAGLHLAIAVLGALVRRLRSDSGCEIEVPMFESMVSFLMLEQLAGQSFQPPLGPIGYDRLLSPHRNPYRSRDGFVSILPYNTTHWVAFLTFIGRTDLAAADWVCDPTRRSQSIDTLYQLIASVAPARSTQEWLSALSGLDIPCAPVKRLDELFEDPHLRDVGLFESVAHPSEGALRSVRTPFVMPDNPSQPDRSAPALGAQSREILAEAGIEAEHVEELLAAGVVRMPAGT